MLLRLIILHMQVAWVRIAQKSIRRNCFTLYYVTFANSNNVSRDKLDNNQCVIETLSNVVSSVWFIVTRVTRVSVPIALVIRDYFRSWGVVVAHHTLSWKILNTYTIDDTNVKSDLWHNTPFSVKHVILQRIYRSPKHYLPSTHTKKVISGRSWVWLN